MSLVWLFVPAILLVFYCMWWVDFRDIPLKCSREYEKKWNTIKGEEVNEEMNKHENNELYIKIKKLINKNNKQQSLFNLGVAYFPLGVSLFIFGASSAYSNLVAIGVIVTIISICMLVACFIIGIIKEKE